MTDEQTAPERIWVEHGSDQKTIRVRERAVRDGKSLVGMTKSIGPVWFKQDYIRSDLFEQLQANYDRLKALSDGYLEANKNLQAELEALKWRAGIAESFVRNREAIEALKNR